MTAVTISRFGYWPRPERSSRRRMADTYQSGGNVSDAAPLAARKNTQLGESARHRESSTSALRFNFACQAVTAKSFQ